MKITVIAFSVFMVLAGAGCQDSCDLILQEDKQLRDENIDLGREVKTLQKENAGLKEQLNIVSGAREGVELKNIISVDNVKLSKRSGLYDKDKDGRVDKLVVYLKTIDEFGDAIKAPGSVEVALWDLDSNGGKIKQWDITAGQLRKKWAGLMMSSYYRLVFDVKDIDIAQRDMTVKVKFTDYITGEVFSKQIVVSSNY